MRLPARLTVRTALGGTPLLCAGCDSPLGQRGSSPAVKMPGFLDGNGLYVHNSQRCRALVVAKWRKEAGE